MLQVHSKANKEERGASPEGTPPRGPYPNIIGPFDIDDPVLDDAAIREVVAGLRNSRAGGSGEIKAKHINVWLWGIREEE